MTMQHWLMKSEPTTFSLRHLERKGEVLWDGVRNFQARNYMQRQMRPHDPILFYHSNTKVPGIVGLAEVTGPAAVDPTQFQTHSDYFDARATKDKPIWFGVRVGFKELFPRLVTLEELREIKSLAGMALLARGQRLSVQPVLPKHFRLICKLARA